jgi:cyclopropane-fatty-acyl-phospholipid synthase
MPSDQLPYLIDSKLKVEQHWRWDGTHYQKTSLAWLTKMDGARDILFPVFTKTYGNDAEIWWQRWRLFFLAVAELFGFNQGQEWWVSHYKFLK